MTSAYSRRTLSVFASAATAPGTRWSRSSDLLPVESMRTSPGSSIATASSAVTSAAVRSTLAVPRASISSLREPSMESRGQNPSTQLSRSPRRSNGMVCLNARLCSSSCASKIASTLSPSIASTL
jgi:hypothetical protein